MLNHHWISTPADRAPTQAQMTRTAAPICKSADAAMRHEWTATNIFNQKRDSWPASAPGSYPTARSA